MSCVLHVPDFRRPGQSPLLLGAGNAYRFTATRTGVLMQQTVVGDLSVQKWREICFT